MAESQRPQATHCMAERIKQGYKHFCWIAHFPCVRVLLLSGAYIHMFSLLQVLLLLLYYLTHLKTLLKDKFFHFEKVNGLEPDKIY